LVILYLVNDLCQKEINLLKMSLYEVPSPGCSIRAIATMEDYLSEIVAQIAFCLNVYMNFR